MSSSVKNLSTQRLKEVLKSFTTRLQHQTKQMSVDYNELNQIQTNIDLILGDPSTMMQGDSPELEDLRILQEQYKRVESRMFDSVNRVRRYERWINLYNRELDKRRKNMMKQKSSAKITKTIKKYIRKKKILEEKLVLSQT